MTIDFLLLVLTLAGLFAGAGVLFLLLTRHAQARAVGETQGGRHG
ncbi:hypothetical protein [Xanthomonas sp. XNM01]|nr:hypothetical protein [Xanthomonas sp. XNM01]